jgi:hypothetical protein
VTPDVQYKQYVFWDVTPDVHYKQYVFWDVTPDVHYKQYVFWDVTPDVQPDIRYQISDKLAASIFVVQDLLTLHIIYVTSPELLTAS